MASGLAPVRHLAAAAGPCRIARLENLPVLDIIEAQRTLVAVERAYWLCIIFRAIEADELRRGRYACHDLEPVLEWHDF